MLITTVAVYGCGTDDTRTTDQPPETAPLAGSPPGTTDGMGATDGETAFTIELVNRQGQPIGTARLTGAGQGVQIAVDARNLPPGPKGFHFHETGRCDAPSFESAGAHFAPMGRQHGLENPNGPHAGDMENLQVGQDGTVNTTIRNPRVTLRQSEQASLIDGDGTAILIHAGEDDQRTDPSGDSGDRIACGVINQQAVQAGGMR